MPLCCYVNDDIRKIAPFIYDETEREREVITLCMDFIASHDEKHTMRMITGFQDTYLHSYAHGRNALQAQSFNLSSFR